MKNAWKFELLEDFEIDLYQYYHKFSDYSFYDIVNGQRVLAGEIKRGKLIIYAGYQWDGCWPKIMLFGKMFGAPDFEQTYEPSLVHSFLISCQYQHFISREVIDRIWSKMLKEKPFKLSWLYSKAVEAYRPIAILNRKCS